MTTIVADTQEASLALGLGVKGGSRGEVRCPGYAPS
jgi:hypothetical protein